MEKYRISGVWKEHGVITHYGFHTVTDGKMSRVQRIPKPQAIQMLEEGGANAVTWIWSYNECQWKRGEDVYVVDGQTEKYLRTEPDDRTKDNLGHLIEFSWIA